MPVWAGKWKGGRFYLDELGRRVFFIERRKRVIKLDTHDEALAVGDLARFLAAPEAYKVTDRRPMVNEPVVITGERRDRYLLSIADTVRDHRRARDAYLIGWSKFGFDLRTADRARLRAALASFTGGHRGRVEALNAFANFLVREGDLTDWRPLTNTHAPDDQARAKREAYSLEQLRECYARLDPGPIRDVFHLRAATGLHHTEVEQLEAAPLVGGPLPSEGAAIRKLPGRHLIAGVLQVHHKNGQMHRQSVDREALAAALRLRDRVPDRVTMWEKLSPLIPSNLRHTFVTLAGEVGALTTWAGAGVDRARIAQTVGHRAGSTMTADRYDKIQVPALVTLPLGFTQVDLARRGRSRRRA